MNTKIKYALIVILIILAFNYFVGTTSLDHNFNKNHYSAMYIANVYDNMDDSQGETMVVGIDVKRNIFYQRKIYLTYIYYEDNDVEFREPNLPLLIVGTRVEVNLDDADYKDDVLDNITVYIELTNRKY